MLITFKECSLSRRDGTANISKGRNGEETRYPFHGKSTWETLKIELYQRINVERRNHPGVGTQDVCAVILDSQVWNTRCIFRLWLGPSEFDETENS